MQLPGAGGSTKETRERRETPQRTSQQTPQQVRTPAWRPPQRAQSERPRFALSRGSYQPAPEQAVSDYPSLALSRGSYQSAPGDRDEPEETPPPPKQTNWMRRDARLDTVYELTDEQFNALTPEQQKAVLFNTGLVSAARADVEAGNSQATRDYLAQLGINTRSEAELNAYLQLDRAIGENLLNKLGQDARIPFTSGEPPQPEPRPGDMVSLPSQKTGVAKARFDAGAAASALAEQLRSSGLFFGQQPQDGGQVGFGTSMHDDIVRKMYATMIDDRYELTTDDVVAGLAEMNEAAGTSVTPEEVWTFLNSQLSAAGLGGGNVLIPWDNDPVTGERVKALKPDEIRKRYGL